MDARTIAQRVAAELVDAGADAVVLGGSVVRGDEHTYSDIDIVALGDGPPYSLRIVDDRLVSVSWSSADGIRQLFDSPPSAGATVPAWRTAEVLVDLRLRARALQEFAHEWRWARIDEACDEWVALEFTGLAEEVFRLAGLVERGNEFGVAMMRSVLALRLPAVLAVHRRLFYATENELWQIVADTFGAEWAAAHRAALGIDAAADVAARAALRMWELAARDLEALIIGEDRAVVAAASVVAGSLSRNPSSAS